MAPELLLGTGHGTPADIWSLGVMMFEFFTGVPPFNDQTKELVFKHILERNIPPLEEPLPEAAWALIDTALDMDPDHRPKASDLRRHPFFEGVNWEHIQDQEAPFVPQPEGTTDTSYFKDLPSRNHHDNSL